MQQLRDKLASAERTAKNELQLKVCLLSSLTIYWCNFLFMEGVNLNPFTCAG
jgi:hypothetical protein